MPDIFLGAGKMFSRDGLEGEASVPAGCCPSYAGSGG